MLLRYGAKFIDKALKGTEIQAMSIIDKAHKLMRIVSNKIDNFNFKLPQHKIPSCTMVSVVDFESEYPGSSPDKNNTSILILQTKYFNDGLTDNRATSLTIDLGISLRGH